MRGEGPPEWAVIVRAYTRFDPGLSYFESRFTAEQIRLIEQCLSERPTPNAEGSRSARVGRVACTVPTPVSVG